MSKKIEKPIAVVTVNKDISKMTEKQREKLSRWLDGVSYNIIMDFKDYGKTKFRLMR